MLATVPEDQPPRGDDREQGEAGAGVGGGAPEVATLETPTLPGGCGHPLRALGSDVGGLWVIGSARFFLGKPWRFVLTESLLRLTRVQTPALPSAG